MPDFFVIFLQSKFALFDDPSVGTADTVITSGRWGANGHTAQSPYPWSRSVN